MKKSKLTKKKPFFSHLVYRNNKKKKWFLKILNKNENSLTPEEVELINKMNINLLYSFKVYENKYFIHFLF